ncbi:MAG TPA: alpha/beta hydrolase-fold protein [Steroidobacteraceae bacterium]|nr:alpha/beta hydrolase-fold protein [Steroidobacteraceae bacterium]
MSTRLSTAIGIALALLLGAPAYPQSSSGAAASPPNPSFVLHTPAGRIERITVHGASLVGNLEGDSPDREVLVYLPPSYAKDPGRRYPVIYLLHGFTDTADLWFGQKGPHFVVLPNAADLAYAHGVHEMIIVMPDSFTKYAGSMYSNSAVTGNWEGFITHDLVKYIDAHYRTLARPASRGLAGHSMGGYGTLRLAMKYPGIFSSVYAMSPCCLSANLMPNATLMASVAQAQSTGNLSKANFGVKAMLASAAAWSPDPRNPPSYFDLPVMNGKPVPSVIAAWAANSPLAMVYQSISNLETYHAIAFDAGDRDTAIAGTVRSLDGILTAFGVKHVAKIYQGNHVDHIQQRLETQVLPYFSDQLSFH